MHCSHHVIACIADDPVSLVVEAVVGLGRTLGHSWVVVAGACRLSCRATLGHSWVVAAGVAAAGTPVADVAIQLLCTCPSGHSRVVAAFGWYSCHRSGLSTIQGSWCREVGGVTIRTYAVVIISAGCLLMLLLLIYAAVARLYCCCLFMLLYLHRLRFIPVICV